MADEIKTRITIEGAEAISMLERLQREEKGLADGTRRTGEAAEDSSQKHGLLGRAWAGLRSQLSGLLVGALSIGALTKALQLNTQAIEENANAANRLKQAQLDLQFLSQGYNAGELRATQAAAELKGGPDALIDMQATFAELKSKTPDLDDATRIALFEQLVETSLTTSAPASALVGLYAKGSQYVPNAQRLQSLIRKAQELSPAASPQTLERHLPGTFEAGVSGGLTAEESTGLLIAALQVDEERGATSLRNILTILAGGVEGEGMKVLQGAGATPERGILAQLDALRKADLSVADMTKLFGRENMVVASGMLGRGRYRDYIGGIYGATQGEGDLTAEAIANIYGEDQQQALRLMTAQAEARVEAMKASDVKAQKAMLGKILLEEALRRHGRAPWGRAVSLFSYDVGIGFGGSAEGVLGHSDAETFKEALGAMGQAPRLDPGVIGDAYRGGGTTVNIGTVIQNGPALETDPQPRDGGE